MCVYRYKDTDKASTATGRQLCLFTFTTRLAYKTEVTKVKLKSIWVVRVMPNLYNKWHFITHAETAADKLSRAYCRSEVRTILTYLASKDDLPLGSFCSKFTVLQLVNSFRTQYSLKCYVNLCVVDRILTLKSKQNWTKRFYQINVKLSPRDLSHKKFKAVKRNSQRKPRRDWLIWVWNLHVLII